MRDNWKEDKSLYKERSLMEERKKSVINNNNNNVSCNGAV